MTASVVFGFHYGSRAGISIEIHRYLGTWVHSCVVAWVHEFSECMRACVSECSECSDNMSACVNECMSA